LKGPFLRIVYKDEKRRAGIMKKVCVLVITCIASLALLAGGVEAKDFHVSTPIAFQLALAEAQNNKQDDTIYLAAGVYTYSGFAFLYTASTTEDYALSMQAESGLTRDQVVLDGVGYTQVLRLSATTDTFTNSHFTIRGITVRNGFYPDEGAGIYVNTYGGDITVEDCILEDNIGSSQGGGVYAKTQGGDILFTGNRFEGNRGQGGAALINTPDTATVIDNEIVNNYSPYGSGGIETQSTHTIAERNLIVENHAGCGNYSGGGLYISLLVDDATVTLTNNVIINNTGWRGGGIYIYGIHNNVRAYVINNTISLNEASDSGGGVYLYLSASATGEFYVYNNIIWGNTATTSGGDIVLSGTPTIAHGYNNDYSDMDGTWTHGDLTNIDADPLFVGGGDYHLLPGSPCIDTGNNSPPAGLPATDIEIAPRVIDGNYDGIATVDMGAYEFPQFPIFHGHDFDGNGTADVSVFRPSNGYWYVRGGSYVKWGVAGDIPVPGDYDGDGTTEIAVFRPSNGYWYVKGGSYVKWGVAGDIPVPGDYDGNGTTEIAVFRPSNGYWYVRGGSYVKWGVAGDIPVPGDYDGDGTTEIAVFRPSNGYWYVRGGSYVKWGVAGDIPLVR
jgi:hypothetical protein